MPRINQDTVSPAGGTTVKVKRKPRVRYTGPPKGKPAPATRAELDAGQLDPTFTPQMKAPAFRPLNSQFRAPMRVQRTRAKIKVQRAERPMRELTPAEKRAERDLRLASFVNLPDPPRPDLESEATQRGLQQLDDFARAGRYQADEALRAAGRPVPGEKPKEAGLFALPKKYRDAVLSGEAPAGGLAFLNNAVQDAAELAVTTPSSLYHLTTTAATRPGKVPGMLAAPFVEAYHDPQKAISEHPVSTALMFAPAVRMPGRTVGYVARKAGKQTLVRPASTLPGTALTEARTGSRDAFVRAGQSRADRRNPAPVMTADDLARRVDEFYDFGKHHARRVEGAAARDATAAAKAQGLSKADTKAAVATRIEGARAGTPAQVDTRFAREFGAVHQVTPEGNVVRPRGATEGALHATRAEAEAVARKLNHKPAQVADEGGPVPLEFVVHKASDLYGVVPKLAAARLEHHHGIGSTKSLGSALLRTTGRAFRTAVLPVSQKWLAGQAIEAGVRSVVAGAGPMDLIRMHRVVKKLNAETPGAGDELLMRVSGGQFGLTGTARDFAHGKSLAEEFEGTALASAAGHATQVGQTAPLRAVRWGWGKYTTAVMSGVNGLIENTSRKAMAGQAIKNSPLIESHVLGLTDKALSDAAHGLKGTDAQVALARAVDRMYGKYQKFSPEMREGLLHWTPFLPWYLNTLKFLTKTLPHDHPLQAAFVAATSETTEDWRVSQGLSLHGPHVKGYLLGRVPAGEGLAPLGQFTPFGVTDPVKAAGDLVLPQMPALTALKTGVDWKGQPLRHEDGRPFTPAEVALYAASQQAGVTIPGLAKLGRVTGLEARYVEHQDVPSVLQGKSLKEALIRELPFVPTSPPNAVASTKVRVKPVKVKPLRIRIKPLRVKPIRVK